MKKGFSLLFIVAFIFTAIWIFLFRNVSSLYYFIISIYMGLGFLALGYFDYRKEQIKYKK